MKKIFIVGSLVLFIACTSNQTKDVSSTPTQTADTVTNRVYPYPVNYTNVRLDDQKNAETLVRIFKLWDEGNVEGQKEYWADTAEIHGSDGFYVRGGWDTILATGKTARNAFDSYTHSINAVLSFTGTNKASGQTDIWAVAWAKAVRTDKGAKTDSAWLHEAIKLNNDGKIVGLYQFVAKISPQ